MKKRQLKLTNESTVNCTKIQCKSAQSTSTRKLYSFFHQTLIIMIIIFPLFYLGECIVHAVVWFSMKLCCTVKCDLFGSSYLSLPGSILDGKLLLMMTLIECVIIWWELINQFFDHFWFMNCKNIGLCMHKFRMHFIYKIYLCEDLIAEFEIGNVLQIDL